jgi:hypothetical protein
LTIDELNIGVWLEFEDMVPFIPGVGIEARIPGAGFPQVSPRTIGLRSKRWCGRFDVVEGHIVYFPGYAVREGSD